MNGDTVNVDSILNIVGSIITVALVTTILLRAGGAAQIIRALGDLLTGALRTAMAT